MPTSNPQLEVYKASAGSGKTFQLALRYISLLLGERQEDGTIRLYTHRDRKMHREILAITFTNKATNEMKQRIITELTLLADLKAKSNYRDILLKRIKCTAEALANAAREALISMLYDYGKIQVSTIDTFFQRVLRSFAYEADLSGNYELSLDNVGLINMAIADTLTQVCGFKSKSALDSARLKTIRKWIERIIDDNYDNAGELRVFDKDGRVRTTLLNFICSLSDENYQAKADKIDRFFDKSDAIDNLAAALKQKLVQIKAEIDAAANAVLADDGGEILSVTSRKWLWSSLEPRMPEPTAAFSSFIRGEKDSSGMCLSKKVTPSIVAHLDEWLGKVRLYWTVATMLDQMYNLGLFHEVLDVAASMKVHLNTILLSDTNTMLNKIIGTSDTPFIYERIGERLHYFLIDEFQDTSMLQWLNLEPLVANSLGSGYDNMIIGDVKQCIYRFRNSYPDLLDTELQRDEAMSYAIRLPLIDTNWRSSIDVVNFNNDLFEEIGRQHGIGSYDTVRQKHDPDALAGYVDVASSADFKQEYIERMVTNMRRQLDSGYSPSDIVVLVRKHKFGAQVVNDLMAYTGPGELLEGLKIVSNESLYLKNANSVKFILSQLRELDRIWNPTVSDTEDDGGGSLPRATEREMDWLQEALRRAQAQGLSSEDAIEKVMNEFDGLGRKVALVPTDEEAWRKRMRGRSLFEIVEELISLLPEPAWRNSEAQYITAFQDLIADYSHHSAPSIGGFLKRWDEKLEDKAAVGLAEGVNAIRIVTIHASKGLEYECVHLALPSVSLEEETKYRWYTADEVLSRLELPCDVPQYFPLKSAQILNATFFSEEYKKLKRAQLIDEINALYVAMTRAMRELIVTFETGGKNSLNASTVVRKALEKKCGSLDEKNWNFTEGTPTQKEDTQGAKKKPIDPFPINNYQVFDRLDLWDSTRLSEDEQKLLN